MFNNVDLLNSVPVKQIVAKFETDISQSQRGFMEYVLALVLYVWCDSHFECNVLFKTVSCFSWLRVQGGVKFVLCWLIHFMGRKWNKVLFF